MCVGSKTSYKQQNLCRLVHLRSVGLILMLVILVKLNISEQQCVTVSLVQEKELGH